MFQSITTSSCHVNNNLADQNLAEGLNGVPSESLKTFGGHSFVDDFVVDQEKENFDSCSDFFVGLKRAVVSWEEYLSKVNFSGSKKEDRPAYSESFDLACEEVKNALLGTNWEIAAPPPGSDRNDLSFFRMRKWARHAVYRDLIKTKAANFCHRALVPLRLPDGKMINRNFVDVWKNKQENFGYGGLITCGSVWNCPVDAPKIAIHRRSELSEALKVAEVQGLNVLHMTQTAPHHLGESLKDLLEKMVCARRLMLHRKPWKRLETAIGIKGTIRALEVTYSWSNGWHVHFHVLLVISEHLTAEQIREHQKIIFEQWLEACLTAGLQAPSELHGVNLADGRSAGEYVGKWGVEDEISKAHLKKGRDGGLSPFEFLDKVLEGDLRYEALFQEYAKAFKGRRQLVWSKGLRELLKLETEISDEKIAESQEPDSELFAQISREVWSVILRKEKRGEVLEACRGGEDNLKEYLSKLTNFEYLRLGHTNSKLKQSKFNLGKGVENGSESAVVHE